MKSRGQIARTRRVSYGKHARNIVGNFWGVDEWENLKFGPFFFFFRPVNRASVNEMDGSLVSSSSSQWKRSGEQKRGVGFGARLPPTDPSIKLVSKLCDRTDRLWPLFHGSSIPRRDDGSDFFHPPIAPESPVENKLRCGLVSFSLPFLLSFVPDEKITDVFGA